MSLWSRITGAPSIRLPDSDPALQDESTDVSTQGIFSRINPFKNKSPLELPADGQPPMEEEPESDLQLSRWDRLLLFAVSMACSLSCYIVSFMLLPVLSLKPRKFALLWSLGSILFLFSFGVLQGFRKYLRHLFSIDRMWFTVSFTLSIVFSLVASIVLKSTILAIISCVVQFVSMIWYTISYFPMGRQGLRLASNLAVVQADSWINS